MHINTIIQYTNKQKLGQKMFLSSKGILACHGWNKKSLGQLAALL